MARGGPVDANFVRHSYRPRLTQDGCIGRQGMACLGVRFRTTSRSYSRAISGWLPNTSHVESGLLHRSSQIWVVWT